MTLAMPLHCSRIIFTSWWECWGASHADGCFKRITYV